MKRTTAALAAIATAAALAGCGGESPDTATPTNGPDEQDATQEATGAAAELPDDIQQAGVLRVGNSPVYPPMSFLPEGEDDQDARVGFDVDLAGAIGEQLGVEVEFSTQPYEQYIPSLDTGRLDLVESAMQDLPERRETVDFVDYMTTGPQLFTTADRSGDLSSGTDLCGGSVVIDVGDVGYRDAVNSFSDSECPADSPIEIVSASGTSEALLQLDQGRADATIRGAEAVRYLVEDGSYALVGEPLTSLPVGIAVAKDNTELRDAVQAALEELLADGTYQQIGEEWGIADLLLDEITINGGE